MSLVNVTREVLRAARAQEIADELIGSCRDLRVVLEPGEIDDMPLITMVEDHVYECEDCGWWTAAEEIQDGMCEDCITNDHE